MSLSILEALKDLLSELALSELLSSYTQGITQTSYNLTIIGK